MVKALTLKEVQKHHSRRSCWVIYKEKVYDVTLFLQDHPGGDDLILEYGGKDVTAIMQDEGSHAHSEAAYDVLRDYCLGELTQPRHFKDKTREELHRRRILDFTPSETNTSRDTAFLDLRRPLIPQFFHKQFTKEFYLEQVHKPRYLPEPAQFFGHALLEPLSKTVWYVIPLVWGPFVAFQLYQAHSALPTPLIAPLFVLGIVIWTLLEYGLHRFLFHVDDHLPDAQWAFLLHFTLHGFHHFLPMDRLRLVVPPALFIVLASPFIKLAHALFPPWIAHTIIAGAIFGYILYDMTHYYLHHARVIAFHFKEMKKYHLAHHWKDFEAGYGITSKFWDHVFGTTLEYNQ
ncbi:hypothetical protein BC940DRAFT_230200 [Gongronella butleri]|nr:hypothetical protein BC940DRAFT_230200 [Gongronella butleri]